MCRRLDIEEAETGIFKLAKARTRRKGDLELVKCIKDEDDRVLVNDEDFKKRWQRYFYKVV